MLLLLLLLLSSSFLFHHYAGYLQLYTYNKPCFYDTQRCSFSVFTVCSTCNVISPVKYILFILLLLFLLSSAQRRLSHRLHLPNGRMISSGWSVRDDVTQSTASTFFLTDRAKSTNCVLVSGLLVEIRTLTSTIRDRLLCDGQ